MRRWISILLALLVGVGPLLWPLNGRDEQHLPACCRRNGAHHCAMSAQMTAWVASGEKTSVTAPLTCPYFPRANSAVILPAYVPASVAAQVPQQTSRMRVPLPSDSDGLSGPGYTYAGRGPPASLLS